MKSKLIGVVLSVVLMMRVPLSAVEILSWDFPEKAKHRESANAAALKEEPPVQYPSAEFDPVLEPGMVLVIEAADEQRGTILSRTAAPILSDEIVSIPGLGVLEIVGKKLSAARDAIRKFTHRGFRVGLLMGNVQTVQVLGKVQKPGNYPGYMKLSYLLAEAMDRSPGSNFKIHFYNGADRRSTVLRYEDVARGRNNPLVPPGSVVYLPPSAGAVFGEMTEKQINLAYLVVVTLAALGITAIAKN